MKKKHKHKEHIDVDRGYIYTTCPICGLILRKVKLDTSLIENS